MEREKQNIKSSTNATFNTLKLLQKGTPTQEILASIGMLKKFYDSATDDDWKALTTIPYEIDTKEYAVERTRIIYGDEAADFLNENYERMDFERGM